nr:hypothetical protein [Tanacetum cinerariifolium]
MSADSVVTYSSVHYKARSWSIPSEDPYEEAAQQLFHQAPHSPEALAAEMNAIASSLYHSLHPSGTPPLLPIPLSTPRNRPLLATPRPGCEEDDGRLRVGQPEGQLPVVRAEIEELRSERLAYEQEGIQTREALARFEAYCRALEARVAVLETYARRLEWQRQAADDFTVQHIMRTQALEAGAHDDTLEDTASRRQIMARTKRGQTPPLTNPNNMTLEAVQTMIDQALLRNSDGEDGSHSLHTENPRNMHTARPYYYANFMKCHPLNFK